MYHLYHVKELVPEQRALPESIHEIDIDSIQLNEYHSFNEMHSSLY